MNQSDESKPEPFKVSVKTGDSLGLILQQIVELRAEVNALTVLTIEALASASGEKPEDIAERYDTTRKECLLRLAFELQDSGPRSPEEQS